MKNHCRLIAIVSVVLWCLSCLSPFPAATVAASAPVKSFAGEAEQPAPEEIEKVYVLFKTHLDVGFTDLSSVVTERYMHDFIPRALDVSERLAAEGTGERYVWTTGSWLIWRYLQTASPAEVERMEAALRRGDIVWNAVPYTVESETMNAELFRTLLLISARLDERYGKHTVAAKMTDVPGHTRSIVTPFCEAGIGFLHIGVNPASPIPAVPPVCRWRDATGRELILMYQQDYGAEEVLPDGHTVLSIHFTGDNHGPHSYEQVKQIYADLRRRYPGAELVPASLGEVAAHLAALRDRLPVVTSEIGDTWIYGYGSAPLRMAKFRRLAALYARWIRNGDLRMDSDEAINFAVELGLIAEHTQGMDIKTHLTNWDKYDPEVFEPARRTPPFQKVEQSWREIDAYLTSAIRYLPDSLQAEAQAALDEAARVEWTKLPAGEAGDEALGREWQQALLGDLLSATGLTYEQFSAADYEDFMHRYLRARYDWALCDFGKPGLEQSQAVSARLSARVVNRRVQRERGGTRIIADLQFPAGCVEAGTLPVAIQVNCLLCKGDRRAELSLTIAGKPAVRLPEAYWLSFGAPGLRSVVVEKVGEPVDVADVVERGNRQMHGMDRYVDLHTDRGTVRLWSDAAFLVGVGEGHGLNYSTALPDASGGVHFNLSNNLWGTNFGMWNEGSLTYHFVAEKVAGK